MEIPETVVEKDADAPQPEEKKDAKEGEVLPHGKRFHQAMQHEYLKGIDVIY